MQTALLDLLRCPLDGCHGRLGVLPGGVSRRQALHTGLLRCNRCSAAYPVLGGVPILLPAPALYVASHRDAVLAALAEAGDATRAAVELVDAMARAVTPPPPAQPFGDDWTEGELEARWPLPPSAATFGGHAFAAFLGEADKRRPEQLLASWLRLHRAPRGGRAQKAGRGWVVDVGCGTGAVARALCPHARRLLVVDHSLRAVQRTLRVTAGEDADVHGVVATAEALPLRARAADAVVAAQLIDLLDDPGALLAEAARCLPARGALLLSTPAPDLADDDGAILRGWLSAAGFAIKRKDTVPWLRAHHGRHYQVYFSELLLAVPTTGASKTK